MWFVGPGFRGAVCRSKSRRSGRSNLIRTRQKYRPTDGFFLAPARAAALGCNDGALRAQQWGPSGPAKFSLKILRKFV